MSIEEYLPTDLTDLPNEELIATIYSLQKQLKAAKYRNVLAGLINDASIDRILAVDTDMKIIAWNKMCEIINGMPQSECLGKDLTEVLPEVLFIPEISRAIKSAMKGYKSFVTAEKGSFSGSYCEHHFVPLVDSDGAVIGVLNIIHDVSHRIKVENELRSLNKALVKKNKELKQKNAELISFSHVAAHDLKEPLRKIYTFTEMVLNTDGENLSDTGRAYFRRIQASAQRMGLLTDDILAYTQINDSYVIEAIDLNEVLANAKKHLSEYIKGRGAIIQCPELPVFNGSKQLITQLFEQMIHNALKFQQPDAMPFIEIEVQNIPGSNIKHADVVEDAEYCCISFSDNGIGFETKYAEKIFRIFQRLHTGDKYPGTGMGLAICNKIAELHQGFITAESEPGKGTKFSCYLNANLR